MMPAVTVPSIVNIWVGSSHQALASVFIYASRYVPAITSTTAAMINQTRCLSVIRGGVPKFYTKLVSVKYVIATITQAIIPITPKK